MSSIATIEPAAGLEQFNAFGSEKQFELAQRMAAALCSSNIVPETYRGKENLGNCVIALEISNRIGANVLAVMQNLYIVHGRPAWSSQFLISCVNASRKFSPLRYKMTGDKGSDTWGCIAWATDRTGEVLESPEVTIAIAKAEGWHGRNGSKWKTLPELMLRYRAATFFTRLYAPEITMGIKTDDEVVDVEAEVVPEPRRQISAESLFGGAAALAAPAPAPTATTAKTEPAGTSINYVRGVRDLAKIEQITESMLLGYLKGAAQWEETITTLEEAQFICQVKLQYVFDNWQAVLAEYRKATAKK